MSSRREFMGGLGAALSAPAIVRARIFRGGRGSSGVNPLNLPLVQSSDIPNIFSYVGSFTTPTGSGTGFSYGGGALSVVPLANNQGGTMYISGIQNGQGNLGYVTIPTLAQIQGGGAAATMGKAPVNLPYVNSGNPLHTTTQGSLVYNGSLYITENVYYDGGNVQNATVVKCSTDLTTIGTPASFGGNYNTAMGPRFFAGQLGMLPSVWRPYFGGPATIVMGPGQGIIGTNVSNGSGFCTFDPSLIGSTGGNVTVSEWVSWPPLAGKSNEQWGSGTLGSCARIHGHISGTVLTIESIDINGVSPGVGSWLYCDSITTAGAATITSLGTVNADGTGTYNLGASFSVANGTPMFISNATPSPCTTVEAGMPSTGGDDLFSTYEVPIGCGIILPGSRSLLVMRGHQYGPHGGAPEQGLCPAAPNTGGSGTNVPWRSQIDAYDLAAIYESRSSGKSTTAVTPYAFFTPIPYFDTIWPSGNSSWPGDNNANSCGWMCYDDLNGILYVTSNGANASTIINAWTVKGLA